jgi:hypothetical protein
MEVGMSQWKPVLLGAVIACSSMAVGALAVGPVSAAAQTRPAGYQECFFGLQEAVDIDNDGQVDTPDEDRLIHVPTGWTVVSAGGNEDGGLILFCH